MRGSAVRAPTQTNSLCWKSSLNSSGADRSQEQRGNGPSLHFCFHSGRFLCRLSVRWTFSWPPEQHLRPADVWRKPGDRGLDMRAVVMGTEWQRQPVQAVCHFPLSLTQGLSTDDVDPSRLSVQVVSKGRQWSAAQCSGIHCEVQAWEAQALRYPQCLSSPFFFHKIKEMSHMNFGVLTQYQAHMIIGIPQWKS